jgi:hypothetical protein
MKYQNDTDVVQVYFFSSSDLPELLDVCLHLNECGIGLILLSKWPFNESSFDLVCMVYGITWSHE